MKNERKINGDKWKINIRKVENKRRTNWKQMKNKRNIIKEQMENKGKYECGTNRRRTYKKKNRKKHSTNEKWIKHKMENNWETSGESDMR